MLNQLDACPVCGGRDLSLDFIGRCARRDDGRAWRVDKCASCSLRFINPQPDWRELSSYYDAAYEAYEPEHGLQSLEAEIERARKTGEFRHIPLRPGLRVLDVGCGGGAFLSVARAVGAEVYGVEPSAAGVASARAAGLPVFHGELHQFLQSAESARRFDVITSNHVVEHHPAPVDLLKQMASLLAPDGYLWFAVPNIESRTAAALKERWHSVDLPFHLMHFTPASMRRAVERAGLRIRREYTHSLPSATLSSLTTLWRQKYLLPRRLSERLSPILGGLAAAHARRMDETGDGEAIIIEATPP
ncbi:MAG: methyltransferase domain-containing protein [Parvularculaceae bacterium]